MKIKSHLIEPDLHELAGPYHLKNGKKVDIHYITPEDEDRMIAFHRSLSETSVYRRYFQLLPLAQRIQHTRLLRVCSDTDPFNVALVAELNHEIIGIVRLTRLEDMDEAEFAIIIRDDMQGKGLGTELLKRMIELGRMQRVRKIVGYILLDNYDMQRLCQKLGFTLTYNMAIESMSAELKLAD